MCGKTKWVSRKYFSSLAVLETKYKNALYVEKYVWLYFRKLTLNNNINARVSKCICHMEKKEHENCKAYIKCQMLYLFATYCINCLFCSHGFLCFFMTFTSKNKTEKGSCVRHMQFFKGYARHKCSRTTGLE